MTTPAHASAGPLFCLVPPKKRRPADPDASGVRLETCLGIDRRREGCQVSELHSVPLRSLRQQAGYIFADCLSKILLDAKRRTIHF